MITNYINPETKQMFTKAMLSHVKDDAEFLALGLRPVHYAYPSYDHALYTIVAKKELKEVEGGYLQEFDVVDRPLDEAKAALKERVTEKRWEKETAGVTVDGLDFKTGVEDRTRLAVALAGMNADEEIDFKCGNGWLKMSYAELQHINVVISKYVEACFSKERALHDTIDGAATVSALASLDLDADWPLRVVE